MVPRRRPSRLFFAAALFCLVLAGGLQAFRRLDCAACHATIAREWRESRHADSYLSPVFRQERERSGCAGGNGFSCHAPENFPLERIGLAPLPREDSLEAGVNCSSCHLDRESVAWADGSERWVPHVTGKSEKYSSGEFCAGCHALGKEVALDCQQCHMPEEPGAATAGAIIAPARAGATHRSHRFAGSREPEAMRRGAELAAERREGALELRVTSTTGAHLFPVVRHHELRPTLMRGREVLWQQAVTLGPDSTALFRLPIEGPGLAAELRFYPVPELWPDSCYVLQRLALD